MDTPSRLRSASSPQRHTAFGTPLTKQAGKEEGPTTAKRQAEWSAAAKSKMAWSTYEDGLLTELVTENGAKNWNWIAEHFAHRGGKQCRERWHNHLRGGITKDAWTLGEEWLLALGVRAYGNKWATMSIYLIGRPDNTIKNHWNCKMVPKKDKLNQSINHILAHPEGHQLSPTEMKLVGLIRQREGWELTEKQHDDALAAFFEAGLNNFRQFKEQMLGYDELDEIGEE